MADFCFKLTDLAGFYRDLNAFTDGQSPPYARMTDAVTGRLADDPGTGADFLAMVEQDATRLDFIYVANLVSAGMSSGPHMDIRASYVAGNKPTPADQAKMTTLLGQLSTFFGAQTPATYTPAAAVTAAYGAAARSYPKTVNGTWVINPPPAVPKFAFA